MRLQYPVILTMSLLAVGQVDGQSTILYEHGEPTVHEQMMLEMINKARRDPAAEMARLGIGLNDGLTGAPLTPAPKPPLAFNPRLLAAARGHSRWMLDADVFSHTGNGGSNPANRMEAAGYRLIAPYGWGENVSWRGSTGSLDVPANVRLSHEGLMRSPGHRANLMTERNDEIGVGILEGQFKDGGRLWNAIMVTQNFASSAASPEPQSSFVLGVVFRDLDGDGEYDAGEGLPGVTVSTHPGTHHAITSSTGGYAVPTPANADGRVVVRATGGGLATMEKPVAFAGNANIKVDFNAASVVVATAPPPDADNDGVADIWDLAGENPGAVRIGSGFAWQPPAGTTGANRFEVKGLPPGLKFDPVTGKISGAPGKAGNFTVQLRLRRGTIWGPWQAMVMAVESWPVESVGSHFALIAREAVVNAGDGGMLSLSSNSGGQFTGSLRLGAASYGFRGQMTGAVGQPPVVAVSIPRRGLPPVSLNVSYHPGDTITGEVTIDGNTAQITGWKKRYDSRKAPLLGQPRGYFTAILDHSADVREPGDLRPVPGGSGWLTLNVDAGGVATVTGKSADGTAFSSSAPIGPNGEIAVWTLMNNGAGSIMGDAMVDAGKLDGGLGWWKRPQPGRLYPLGFGSMASPVAVAIWGAAYTAPAKNQTLSAWGLVDTPNNATTRFAGTDAAESAARADTAFRLTPSAGVILAKAGSSGNPTGLKLGFSARDGKFSGSFVLSDPDPNRAGKMIGRAVGFDGVVVMRDLGSGVFARGRFLVPALPVPGQSAAATLIVSGAVGLCALPMP